MVAIFVAIVLFAVQGSVVQQAGASAFVYWILGFLTFLIPGAIVTGQLGLMFPGEGSIYVWTNKALGSFWGFFAGFCAWWPGALVMVATADLVVTLLQFLLTLPPFSLVILALLGIEVPLNMGVEIKDRKAITKYLVWGSVVVMAAYLLLTFGAMVVIPQKDANSTTAILQAVQTSLGAGVAVVVTLIMIAFFLFNTTVYNYSLARLLFVSGIDRRCDRQRGRGARHTDGRLGLHGPAGRLLEFKDHRQRPLDSDRRRRGHCLARRGGRRLPAGREHGSTRDGERGHGKLIDRWRPHSLKRPTTSTSTQNVARSWRRRRHRASASCASSTATTTASSVARAPASETSAIDSKAESA